MRKEYILTEEEKQRKRQKIEENRIRKSSITSEDVITHAVLVRTVCIFVDIISAVTIIEIDIEIAIFHGDRMGSKSRSCLFDLCRFSLGDGHHVM